MTEEEAIAYKISLMKDLKDFIEYTEGVYFELDKEQAEELLEFLRSLP